MNNGDPNLARNLHTDDGAQAIENAVRTAVTTVMEVTSDACSRRVEEYRRTVAERDREIRRLRGELEELRAELLRHQRAVAVRDREIRRLQLREKGPPRAVDSVHSDLQQLRPCGVGAATPASVSSRCSSSELFPHQHSHTATRSWEGQEPVPGHVPSTVKEEPCEGDSVIKWEVCEGSLLDQLDGQHPQKDAVKTANPHLSKLLSPPHRDETAARLRRKRGGINGSYLTESEEEEDEGVVKKPFIDHLPWTKVTATTELPGSVSSPEPLKLGSNISSLDPLMFQQPALVTLAASQPTCDPILLEVLVSLETIKQQNTTVLKILQSGSSCAAVHSEPPDVGTLPLPLQSVQDLRSLENRLSSEPELKKKMISYLGLSGGMTTKDSVWRIMAKLFTNTLAKNVNWRGRNNKQKIESLTIKKVVLNAVRQNTFCKNAVDEEIEKYMKRWLQLAGDRDGGRKRRQEKGKEAMGNMMRNYCVGEMFAGVIE